MLFNVTDGESAGEQHLGDVPNHFDLQNWIDAVSVISLAILHAWVGTSPPFPGYLYTRHVRRGRGAPGRRYQFDRCSDIERLYMIKLVRGAAPSR